MMPGIRMVLTMDIRTGTAMAAAEVMLPTADAITATIPSTHTIPGYSTIPGRITPVGISGIPRGEVGMPDSITVDHGIMVGVGIPVGDGTGIIRFAIPIHIIMAGVGEELSDMAMVLITTTRSTPGTVGITMVDITAHTTTVITTIQIGEPIGEEVRELVAEQQIIL